MRIVADISYTIIETLALLPADPGKRYHKELNLVSWGGRQPVYDLRGWNDGRSEMTKGTTLTKEELIQLKEKLGGIEL